MFSCIWTLALRLASVIWMFTVPLCEPLFMLTFIYAISIFALVRGLCCPAHKSVELRYMRPVILVRVSRFKHIIHPLSKMCYRQANASLSYKKSAVLL